MKIEDMVFNVVLSKDKFNTQLITVEATTQAYLDCQPHEEATPYTYSKTTIGINGVEYKACLRYFSTVYEEHCQSVINSFENNIVRLVTAYIK